MLESYIAAGFDPARFWAITPAMYAIEMKGAARRLEIERSHVWWGAMLPHLKDPPSFADFVCNTVQPKKQSPEELQAMCDALAAAWGATKVT